MLGKLQQQQQQQQKFIYFNVCCPCTKERKSSNGRNEERTTAKAVRCKLEDWSLVRILEESNLCSRDQAEVITPLWEWEVGP